MEKQRIRVLMVRLGMDAHWRGSMVVARALRDAGMEVIYGGNQMPANIVRTALQEGVDVIGLIPFREPHDPGTGGREVAEKGEGRGHQGRIRGYGTA